MSFLGKHVNLKTIVRDGVTGYVLADPEMEKQLKDTYVNVRILVPGSMGTKEYKLGRTTVYIDENGTIYEITAG